MDDIRLKKIIQDLESKRQIWFIYCRPSISNKKFIFSHGIDEGKIVFNETEAINENVICGLKVRKPDYLLVLESDYDLIDETRFIYEWGGKHFLLREDGYIISRQVKSYVVEISKNVVFGITTGRMDYQQEYEEKVDAYWNYLINTGKKFYNGEMYSLVQVLEDEDCLRFMFGKTDYKHLIYSKEHDFRNEFHTCTTASIALIETIDGYSVLGKMSNESAFADQFKCIGGALSSDDIIEMQVDINHMFRREILEEMGIDIYDKELCLSNTNRWLLIRERLAFVGVCNIIQLNMTKEKLTNHFLAFHEQDKEKEVSELLFVNSYDEILSIEDGEKADYVDELYKCYFLENNGMSWEHYKRMNVE